jgi:hypothetical protein
MAHPPPVAAISGAPPADASAATSQPWPEPKLAWWAVSVFALALMFGELDRGIMTLLVEQIKADLRLSDTQISLLLGFALIVFNAFIAVPASRFVDRLPTR